MTDVSTARGTAPDQRRVGCPWGALALGALYGLFWLVAELLILTTLPLPTILAARALLLVPLPWLVVLHAARRSQAALARPGVALLTLGITLLGALPAVVFSTSHTRVEGSLLAALVLPPGLSLGAALAFDAARSREFPVPASGAPATAGYAGCGFVLPLIGFALLMVGLFLMNDRTHFVTGTGNYGGLVVVFFSFTTMFLFTAALCGYVLTVIGGRIGRRLATWKSS
jgi:hypothetical protein